MSRVGFNNNSAPMYTREKKKKEVIFSMIYIIKDVLKGIEGF